MLAAFTTLAQLCLVASLLGLLAYGSRLEARARALAVAVALVVIAYQLHGLSSIALSNLRAPREWDFMCFWVWGRLAVTGADFYDPAAGAPFAQGFGLSADFARDILQVGFWYPPPTMLLLAPLGWLEPRPALALWYGVQLLTLPASVWLLWSLFARDSGRLGLLVTGTLTLAMPSMKSTFWYAQSHLLVLLLLLLTFKDARSARAGLWAAVATMIKPYALLWLGHLALVRNWRAVGAGAGVIALACTIAGVLFGWDGFSIYVFDNPLHRAGLHVHTDPVNQSLHATLLRLTGTERHAREPIVTVPFALLAAGIIGVCASVVHRLKDFAPSLGLAFTITSILVTYPSTLSHYSILLLAPLFVLWSLRSDVPGGAASVGTLVVAVFALASTESLSFWANALTWLALLAVAVRALPARAS